MKKLGIVLMASVLGAGVLTAQTVVELFQKAKTQVKSASYDDALKTLDALDAESAKPGHEAERKQVEPPLLFYRGVCSAAVGKKDDAKAFFVTYLGLVPNASIDGAAYPKKAVAAFDEARKEVGAGASSLPSMAASYAAYKRTGTLAPETPGEDWAAGPVHALLSETERRDYTRMTDPLSRSEFVTKFWAGRDPKPETPENEFREEFERRVAFADANFAQDEVRGSLTDRGIVFLLMGPPTFAGRRPIGAGEDSMEALGMSTAGPHDAQIAINAAAAASPSGKTTTGSQNTTMDRTYGPNSTALDGSQNWREVWHFRRELLPPGLPYQQVDFDFITRKGYGKNVLQRDAPALNTMQAAKKPKTLPGKG
jgi:GWxTD domain-containing protein